MTDQEFRDMLLGVLQEIKEQGKERDDRLEKRLDAIELRQERDNERLEKRLDAVASQAKENNDRLEKRLDSMDTHVAQMRQDVGWIKGKLEGKQEGSGRMLTVFTTGAAIAAVIIALIALFSG